LHLAQKLPDQVERYLPQQQPDDKGGSQIGQKPLADLPEGQI
jgi:hypothetical protein